MRTTNERKRTERAWQCRGRCRQCLQKISGRRRVGRCLCGGAVDY